MNPRIIRHDTPFERFEFENEIPTEIWVSELFTKTIQGEGIYSGHPAIFLRLAGCSLNCSYCDTKHIWTKGKKFSVSELIAIFMKYDLISDLQLGTHLVITGGSPLLQQDAVIDFLQELKSFSSVFVEIENEAVIMPKPELLKYIDCWNNSPKLEFAKNEKPTKIESVIRKLSDLENSWFKFVIRDEKDWEQIYDTYIRRGLILRNQVILMPLGRKKSEILEASPAICEISIKNYVKFSNRNHLILWDLQEGR